MISLTTLKALLYYCLAFVLSGEKFNLLALPLPALSVRMLGALTPADLT